MVDRGDFEVVLYLWCMVRERGKKRSSCCAERGDFEVLCCCGERGEERNDILRWGLLLWW